MNEKERKSCIFTIKTLMNLAYNIHGVMDVVDVDNCKKIIEMLGSGYLAGRWVPDDSELGIKCNKCGKSFSDYVNAGTEYMFLEEIPNFCPNCGEDMRGETNG